MKEKKKEKEKKKVQNGWLNKMDMGAGWLFGWEGKSTHCDCDDDFANAALCDHFFYLLTHATPRIYIYILCMFVFLFFFSRFLNAA